jgi:hypothetical protein
MPKVLKIKIRKEIKRENGSKKEHKGSNIKENRKSKRPKREKGQTKTKGRERKKNKL